MRIPPMPPRDDRPAGDRCEVTLRDHFAAAALTGVLSQWKVTPGNQSPELAALTVVSAYQLADAMLGQRDKTSVGVSATGAESGSTPDAQGFGRSNEYPCQPFDSAPTTDQERFVRFQSAVMNWISEATGFFHDDVLRTDDARDVITDACSRCWDAFDRISYPSTNHDAAPAARAETSVKEPMVHATGEPGGEPEGTIGTGGTNQSASACDGADVPSTPTSGGPINRAAQGGQSPDGTGESERRDVPQPDNGRAAGGPARKTTIDVGELLDELRYIANGNPAVQNIRITADDAANAIDMLRVWVNELQLSKVELDALQHVVEDGRLVDLADYGRLRSLLVRLRPEWEDEPYEKSDEKRVFYDTKSPRNGALSGCETVPDPDSRVWETPCTPQPHATPPQGSVQGEGSVPDSRKWNEPVAWAVMAGDWFHDVRLSESGAEWYASYLNDKAGKEKCRVVPLYRHPQPTLTDEEREAVEQAIDAASGMAQAEPWAVATLRNLLERLA